VETAYPKPYSKPTEHILALTSAKLSNTLCVMFSTRQAAKQLGLGAKTLSHYIATKKIPAPRILKVGSASLHAWTEEDIERVRRLLPKIANGRKTRHLKQRQKKKPNK